jgi:hypothetical protein
VEEQASARAAFSRTSSTKLKNPCVRPAELEQRLQDNKGRTIRKRECLPLRPAMKIKTMRQGT